MSRRSQRRADKARRTEPDDDWTGYYVAGRDWPAISSDIPLEDIYAALERITDEDVRAALASLGGDGL